MSPEQKKAHERMLQILPVRTHMKMPVSEYLQGRRMTSLDAQRVQKEILDMEKEGLTVTEIAGILGIGRSTVRNHSRLAKESKVNGHDKGR